MLGTPKADNIMTVNTTTPSNLSKLSSQLRTERHPTSNSTAVDMENTSPDTDSNLSSISPLKVSRDNSMSQSSSSSFSSDNNDHNISLFLKHNINAVNLDDQNTQKIALQYLLEKVRDIETLLIESVKDNKMMKEELSELYRQNDSLAAENLTLRETISNQGNEHRVVSDDLVRLKEILKSEREKFVNYMSFNNTKYARDVDAIQEDIDYLGDLVPDIRELQHAVKELQVENGNLKEEIYLLDKEVAMTNQYNRRQNLVIDGIPDNVPVKDLEDVCLNIIHQIGFLPVGNYEVVGCHRLKRRPGDKSAPTIIRFVNRKITEFCLKNRWRLKNLKTAWNLSFREDLCDLNATILARCEYLKSQGQIHDLYTSNGSVKIVTQNKSRPIKISHIRDINLMFPRD